MKFTELESLMFSKGVNSLAEIARILDTTPQAVSNWKARDQVPYHVVAKINESISHNQKTSEKSSMKNMVSDEYFKENTIGFSDVLLTLSQQLKIILLIPFITTFIAFTYVQLVQKPEYISSASILLPENKNNMGGLSGLASQFGVNIPSRNQADLSSPSLFPDLLSSRTFAKKILDKKFFTEKHNKKLSLLAILTDGDKRSGVDREDLISVSLISLNKMLKFTKKASSPFSIISVSTPEPLFSKNLADSVLKELEMLNRFFKNQKVNEKTLFIEERINSVNKDLELSEQKLKVFNEQNRQISSPSLQLELDRLNREVEVQKGIYLTLKQQLELAKIDVIQEISIVQILDPPEIPLDPSNKNITLTVLSSGFLGIIFGIVIGLFRSYLNNSDVDERRKLRRVKNFVKKKSKDIVLDKRISAIVSILLIIGLPFYLSYESKVPVYFGKYSTQLMIVIFIYLLTLLISTSLWLYLSITKIQKNS